MIQSIAADGNITNESDESLVIDCLLMAKPFSMTFKNNYINAVYREQLLNHYSNLLFTESNSQSLFKLVVYREQQSIILQTCCV